MTFSKTVFVDGDSSKKVTATWLNTLQDWLLAHKSQHAPGGSDSVFPATGSAGFVHQAADGTLALSNPAGSGDVVGPASATDGHLAVFDGATGKLLKDGGAPGGGGASLWTALTATTDFATTAPATNQITMNADKTATILVGYALKIVFNSNTYYVRVSAITSSLITFEGPPITTGAGLLTAVSWGDESRITDSSLVIQMPGYVDPQAEGNYVNNRIGIPNGIPWVGPKAYLTGFKFRVNTADSGGSQPIINVLVGTWVAGTTSTTSIAIGTGSKTFTTASSDQYAAGQLVVIRSSATPANAMLGIVTSCSGTSLVVNVVAVTGTGTIAAWTVSAGGMYPVSTSNSSGGVTLSSSVANTSVDITVISNTNISISPGQTLEISVFPGATTPGCDAYGGVMSVYAVTP